MDERSSPTWRVTDEFAARLGCGLITALTLPLWFGLMFLAVDRGSSDAGIWILSVIFVASLGGAIVTWIRIRSVPRQIILNNDRLEIDRGGGPRTIPVADIETVRVGERGRLRPVSLELAGGRKVKMSRDLADFEGFLTALQATNTTIQVFDDQTARQPDPSNPEPPDEIRPTGHR